MEIFGGFMVMLSILGFFLTVIWFILPFVILSVKGRVDRILLLAEETDKRLKAIEERLDRECPAHAGVAASVPTPPESSDPVSSPHGQ